METLFDTTDYRAIIAHVSASHGERGYQKRLADAAGCKPSYLSKALKGECELTPDHAAGIALFWKLTPLETRYFLESVHLARAGTPKLRGLVEQRLAELRREHRELATRFALPTQGTDQVEYYAVWYMAAIHILTSVPETQTVAAIARRLALAAPLVETALARLQSFGLVEARGDRWVAISGSMHAPRGSSLAWLHLANWRQRALHHAQSEGDGVHFSSVYSLSKADLAGLKEALLAYLGRCVEVVKTSPEETAVAINLDFFEL